jgi:hypothetical protein
MPVAELIVNRADRTTQLGGSFEAFSHVLAETIDITDADRQNAPVFVPQFVRVHAFELHCLIIILYFVSRVHRAAHNNALHTSGMISQFISLLC